MINGARTCLVTGGSRGIGAAVADHLESAGHRVVRVSRSAPTSTEPSSRSWSVVADLSDRVQVDQAIATVEARWGNVEVLVANAGIAAAGPVTDETDEQWDRIIEANLTSPFWLFRRVLPAMLTAGWGRIVAIGSVASLHGEAKLGSYTASKHGLLGLVRSVAMEVASKGITVNAVCPGYVDTDMTARSVKDIASRLGESEERALARLTRKQPIGRLISPEEVAHAVGFCIGNRALNGQTLVLDGGAVQT